MQIAGHLDVNACFNQIRSRFSALTILGQHIIIYNISIDCANIRGSFKRGRSLVLNLIFRFKLGPIILKYNKHNIIN